MTDEIRRADEDVDDVVTEAWERVSDEPHIRCVDAGHLERYGYWSVGVAVMEFVREGEAPYEGLRDAIEASLAAVQGVDEVQREDNEVWVVRGTPSGKELTAAVARVVDDRADELRAWYDQLS